MSDGSIEHSRRLPKRKYCTWARTGYVHAPACLWGAIRNVSAPILTSDAGGGVGRLQAQNANRQAKVFASFVQ
jgi:hypothetical protein